MWSNGDEAALNRLIPNVERELHRIAHYHMAREDSTHTLQTTALVNEAYLKLINQNVRWQNRAHFFAIASQLMRRILLDHARTQLRAKRGGGAQHVPLTEVLLEVDNRSAELVALDQALDKLAHIDPQKSKIVEMRYFGGLSVEEIAEVLKVAPSTIRRHWAMAKAWLRREINAEA
jgi:RNA polymerase sigma-70 factor, ECF subfamily